MKCTFCLFYFSFFRKTMCGRHFCWVSGNTQEWRVSEPRGRRDEKWWYSLLADAAHYPKIALSVDIIGGVQEKVVHALCQSERCSNRPEKSHCSKLHRSFRRSRKEEKSFIDQKVTSKLDLSSFLSIRKYEFSVFGMGLVFARLRLDVRYNIDRKWWWWQMAIFVVAGENFFWLRTIPSSYWGLSGFSRDIKDPR